MYLVYLLLCLTDGRTYVGATSNLAKRLKQHNDGKGAEATKNGAGSWICLVSVEEFASWAGAVQFENALHRPWILGLTAYGCTTSAATHTLANRLICIKRMVQLFGKQDNLQVRHAEPVVCDILEQFFFDVICIE